MRFPLPEVLFLSGILLAGCGSTVEEQRQADELAAAARRQADEAERARRLKVVEDRLAEICQGGADPSALPEKWATLEESMKDANEMAVNLPPGLGEAAAGVVAVHGQLNEVQTKLTEGRALVPPQLEEPMYSAPEYKGAWYLSGSYRANYKGESGGHEGVVVTKGDRYFVVLGAQAEEGFIRYLNGYVEDTGAKVTLDVGRYGRDADVVRLSDRETFRDDQERYADEVAGAKAAYKAQLEEYRRAVKEQAAARKQLLSAMSLLEKEEKRLKNNYARAVVETVPRICSMDGAPGTPAQ